MAVATRPYPATADDHPARKPVRYSAVERARTGSLATVELHHCLGHDQRLPERLIAADPEFFLRTHIAGQSKTPGSTGEALFAEYLRCYADPATRHAICEDYRAAASIDLEHDAADARVRPPLLALWGAKGTVGQLDDVSETWRDKATDVSGHALDCGHTLQEEAPEVVLAALLAFLAPDEARIQRISPRRSGTA